ncbi:MAG TPA: hypothetical protein V6D10_10125 [Trichocoleus sp.]|jgi:hypothetical protein
MNLRLTLKLMTIPTLMGSVLASGILAQLASATDTSSSVTVLTSQAVCDSPSDRELELSTIRHRTQGIAIASADLGSGETAVLDFSEAESDAAAVLFGCDCPACINALRQLRNQSLFNNGNGHCWTSLQRRVSPQRMQEVLQNLEMREAE